MDGIEGDSRYMSSYDVSRRYGSTRPIVTGRNVPQHHSQLIADNYVHEDEVEEDEEEVDAGDGEGVLNGSVQPNGGYGDNDDDTDSDDDDDGDDDNGGGGEDYRKNDDFNLHRHPKKRKLKSLSLSFELAPRVPPPPPLQPLMVAPTPKATKPGRRNTLTDWSEHETFILLDAWGERFLQRGRKSLRSEEWQEVADRVSRGSKLERTDTQCRNRLDTLKKKYKKEKAWFEQNLIENTKWVYFKKMDMLMTATPPQQGGLSCRVDSGEFALTNPNAHLNCANGLAETRVSPGNTNPRDGDDDEDDDDDEDLLPPKRSKSNCENVNGGSFKLLADSINRFSEIYEKIEYGKRKQMMELEKMRMDFYKDLELQKLKILDRARDEIAKIRQGNNEENDGSAENIRR